MPRRHANVHRRRRLAGNGFATDLLKKLAMETLPGLLTPAAKETGEWIGSKVKKLTGGSSRLAGEERYNGGSAYLSGLPPSIEKQLSALSLKKRRQIMQ